MGCTSSTENKGASESSNKKDMQVLKQEAKQEAKPASSAVLSGNGVGGLNALGAEKLDMSALVEKEDFHEVYTLGEVLGKGNFSVVRKGTKKNVSRCRTGVDHGTTWFWLAQLQKNTIQVEVDRVAVFFFFSSILSTTDQIVNLNVEI